MRRRILGAVLVVATAAGGWLAAPVGAIAVTTPLVDLGTLGGRQSYGGGVNEHGQVVGSATLADGHSEGFFAAPNSPMRSIGSLCPVSSSACVRSSSATDINESGQITGSTTGPFASEHAFRYDSATDTMVDLGTLGGERSMGLGISEDGVVVGSSYSPVVQPNGRPRAFAAVPGEPMEDLGSLRDPLQAGAQANGINARGTIVGSSNYSDDPNAWHPVLWDLATGAITDLGAMGYDNAYGDAISDNGFVTGLLTTPAGARPFLFDPTTATMRELPAPPGMQHASGIDVNDHGVVLISGTEVVAPFVYVWHTFVYDSRTDQLVEVEPIAGASVSPSAISNGGVIVASSNDDQASIYWHAARGQVQVAPGAPTALSASGCGSTATLTWSAPDFTGYATALAYEVRRDGTVLGSVDDLTFTDTAAPTTATYEVIAVNDGGASAPVAVSWQGAACPTTTTTSTAPASSSTTTSTARGSGAAAAVVTQPRFTG